MSELPKGWVETTIDRITSDVSYGVTAKSDPHQGDLRMLRITDIQNNKVDWETVPFCLYDSRFEKAFLANEDIVVARTGATVGKSFLIENAIENSVYASYLIRLRVAEHVLPKYVAWFLHSPKYWQQIIEKQEGIGQPNVNGTKLKTLQLSLAPLAEQKRIVEKLDQVLAQVDTIKARLDGIPPILKRFRQSVLAAAVSGKLTEEWRGNSIFIKHELSEQWKWKDIPESWSVSYYSELVESRLGKMLDKAKNTGLATKYLGNINVRWLHIDLTNTQEILVSEQERQDLSLQKGDVLICEGGEPGRCAIWASSYEQSIIFQKALHRARVKSKIIPEWLVYNLKNDADSLFLNQLFTGTTIKHLTGKALKSYPLRVPPIEEQTEIVRLVDQYFAFADTIEKQVQKAQQRVDKLTQSILAKAFRGELVPQNPDDEPADELLKRIAAARTESEALAKVAKKINKKNQ